MLTYAAGEERAETLGDKTLKQPAKKNLKAADVALNADLRRTRASKPGSKAFEIGANTLS